MVAKYFDQGGDGHELHAELPFQSRCVAQHCHRKLFPRSLWFHSIHQRSYGTHKIHQCVEAPEHQENISTRVVFRHLLFNFWCFPVEWLIECNNCSGSVFISKVAQILKSGEHAWLVSGTHVNDGQEDYRRRPKWSQSLCSMCTNPFQLGAGCLKCKDISSNTLTRWSVASRIGKGLNFMFRRVCFAKRYSLTSTLLCLTTSKSAVSRLKQFGWPSFLESH